MRNFLCFLYSSALAEVTILTQPQDTNVTKGGDATLCCAAMENGMTLQFVWIFTPVGESPVFVVNNTEIAGSMVLISGDDRGRLTLSKVRREMNGATVVCSALGYTGNLDSNPATVNVQCKCGPYIYTHAVGLFYCGHCLQVCMCTTCH